MKKIFIAIALLLLASHSYAQMDMHIFDDDSTTVDCSYASLDLGTNNSGISFGNSPVWNGIRFNFSDCGIKEINGINITLWKPEENPGSKIKGIALGLSPFAGELHGISLGILASVAEDKMQGINFGGLALVSGGNINGINFGGLAAVAQEDMLGINLGGLAVVAQGSMKGINFGGLASVSQGNQYGINIGGLACVTQGEMKGINIGGIALVTQKNIYGINFSGIALVTQGDMKGINFGGLALVGQGDIYGLNQALLAVVSQQTIKGLNIVGYKTEADEFRGLNFTAGWTKVNILKGVSVSIYNKIQDTQNGLTIGIFNIAENLNGVQIGLINIAKNNKGISKVMPFINAHFD